MSSKTLNALFLSMLLILVFCISPIISVFLNMYICYRNRKRIYYILLIFNLSLINMFRIPHSDYYRYHKYYYYLKGLSINEFLKTLPGNPDYLFYIQKYIFARNGIEFSIWAFFYSLACYTIIYFLTKDMKDEKYRLGVFILINPFNITRYIFALVFCIYAFYKVNKKYLKYTIYVFGILYHKFMIIFFFFELLKKNKIKLTIKNFFISILIIFGVIYFGKNYLFSIFKISNKYSINSLGNFLDFSFQNLRVKIDFYINFFIIIFYFSIKKYNIKEMREDNLYRYLILIVIPVYFISNIIFGRFYHIVTFLIIYSFMNLEKEYNKKKELVLKLLLLLQLIIYTDEVRYGYKTQSYPFKIRLITIEKVNYYLDKSGHIKIE